MGIGNVKRGTCDDEDEDDDPHPHPASHPHTRASASTPTPTPTPTRPYPYSPSLATRLVRFKAHRDTSPVQRSENEECRTNMDIRIEERDLKPPNEMKWPWGKEKAKRKQRNLGAGSAYHPAEMERQKTQHQRRRRGIQKTNAKVAQDADQKNEGRNISSANKPPRNRQTSKRKICAPNQICTRICVRVQKRRNKNSSSGRTRHETKGRKTRGERRNDAETQRQESRHEDKASSAPTVGGGGRSDQDKIKPRAQMR
ncbi:hypothetical protein K438DRAFT_600023 [Mycena galopus ATCC 62051]|nr:hypothetical protein K438DRAFT_600023 [Mycena galopus ATCC 62051]